ncbi:MAG: DNA modification methylase [Psychroserpens sp.]|jgi:DNA modification methylase
MSVNVIRHKDLNESLYTEYVSLIENLYEKHPISQSDITKEGVNFSGNRNTPIARWFYYKEAYSPIVVEKFLRENKISEGQLIIDPFCGVGTTLLECKKNGVNAVGFDMSPVASFVSNVKCSNYDSRDIEFICDYMIKHFSDSLSPSKNEPTYGKFNDLFPENLTKDILKIKGFYENCSNEKAKNLFKLAYLSIVGEFSNRVKDGNGLKKRKKYDPPCSLLPIFKRKIDEYIQDINISPRESEPANTNCVNDSILNIDNSVYSKDKFDGVIFSPPYPNCFDYTEVYKLEMWLGEFVSNVKDFRSYRDIMIRSSVNCKFSHVIEHPNNQVNLICDYLSTFNIWNEKIPLMIKGYFDDMTKVLMKLYEHLNHNSPVYIIVANSCYKSVLIPTDALLASIGKDIGFNVEGIEEVRKIRASSQQMSVKDTCLLNMRESIIKLRK